MQLSEIIAALGECTLTNSLNRIPGSPDIRIFDGPLIGVASVDDPLFERLKLPEMVGFQHLSPGDWLAGSKSVISYFLPFTAEVRMSNRSAGFPSQEWLFGRIEGQNFIAALSRMLEDYLRQAGHLAITPALDNRFQVISRRSNWSERHVAFIAGLGTLSLNRSLITQRGSAGRIGSVLTDLVLPVTCREYEDIGEYCNLCGACIRRCPPQAINKSGKDHDLCDQYLAEMLKKYSPRYGCGKCQTAVPCEDRIPPRINRPEL